MREFDPPQAPWHCAMIRTFWTPHALLLQMQSLLPKLDQIGLHSIGPQHSHMTHPMSFSCGALDIFCDAIVDVIILLDYFCYLLFLLAHFFQQCLCGWSGSFVQHFFLPLLWHPNSFIYCLWKLKGLILPWLSPLCQNLCFPPKIFNLFTEILPFSDAGAPLWDWQGLQSF